MSSESHGPRRITDARTIRALAHPVRIALMEALGRERTLTATEAAELVGESPTNCAFHLRTLAKYGFVEEAAGGTGRRRPWQLVHTGFSFDDDAGDPETRQVSQALSTLLWETWLERLRDIAARRSGFREAWRKATSASETVLYLTPAEYEDFSAEMLALLTRYHERIADPALRPSGSVPVELVQFTYPLDAVARPGRSDR